MNQTEFSAKARFAVVRLVRVILPPHHQDWAEAMFNEMAYIPRRGAALRWALGSAWCAIRLRVSYEFGQAARSRGARVLLGLVAATVIAALGVYGIQKPYQRERIRAALFHGGSARNSGKSAASSLP